MLAILVLAASACAPGAGGSPSTPMGRVEGAAVAGPTCPVVTDPPRSGCEDRAVPGATLVIVAADGQEVATATTGDDGRFAVDLPPGTYEIQPQPVDGLMGTADPVSVTVTLDRPAEITLSYDTGIR